MVFFDCKNTPFAENPKIFFIKNAENLKIYSRKKAENPKIFISVCVVCAERKKEK